MSHPLRPLRLSRSAGRRHPVLAAVLFALSLVLLPVAGPLSAQEAPPPVAGDTIDMAELPELDTAGMLDLLAELTGRTVLRQQNLPNVTLNIKFTRPLTRDEAIIAIESLLALNGIAVTEIGENFLKAVPSAVASQQVPTFLEETTLTMEPSQKVYVKLFDLDFLTTQEATAVVQPLMSQGSPVQFDKAGSLLITDSLVNLQRIEEMLGRVDRPTEQDFDLLFYTLQHIPAEEFARRLESLQNGILRRYLENNTSIEADERTNQVIIFTHPSNKALIEDLVARLDIDVAPLTRTEIFHIKHGDAEEIAGLIEQVISGQQEIREESDGRGGAPQQGQNANQAAQAQAARAQASGAAAEGSGNMQFSDFLTIVADPRANAILASGTPTDLTYLEELINKIDILLAQVRIEVIIAEVALNEGDTRGIDTLGLTYNYSRGGTDGDGNSTGGGADGTYDFIFNPFQYGGVEVLNRIDPENFAIDLVLNAVETNSRATVLSAPTLVTTHNQEASINIGESRPIVTSTTSDLNSIDNNNTIARSTIQYRDIGIELTVLPLIGANGIIQLEINQKVDNVAQGGQNIDGNELPIITRREATSYVSVGDGQLVVLGGLQSRDDTDARSQVALLGRIPVLGELFKKRVTGVIRRELLIFIRPKIIRNPAEASADTRQQIEYLQDPENVKRFMDPSTRFDPAEPETDDASMSVEPDTRGRRGK